MIHLKDGSVGLVQTGVEVFDGKVQVNLRPENGEYNGVSENFEAGEAGAIIGNTEFAEFVTGEDGTNKQEIQYKELPKDVAKVLVDYIDDGEELSIEKEVLMDYISLSEHKMETQISKEATCTEDGYKEVCCVICNEITETIVIPATGHVMGEWEIVQNPTCVKTGKKQRNCTVCKTYIEEETIPELEHTEGEMQVVYEATCTKEGTQVRTCTRCETEETQSIAAIGHILNGNHKHQNLVMDGSHYVSCTCITYCTRPECGEEVSVPATVRNSLLGIMVQYFCNNCNQQI